MKKNTKLILPSINMHILLLILVFLFSFLPKTKLLLISDCILLIHFVFLSKFFIKKNLILELFFKNENLFLSTYFLLFFLFSIINLLYFNIGEIKIDLKLFRLFLYFIYVNLILNISKKYLKKIQILNYFQTIVFLICIISALFIFFKFQTNTIFLTKDALWQKPLGYRIVDLSGYDFSINYIGNTVNSFAFIIFISLVISIESYLVYKKSIYFFSASLFLAFLILTFSQSGIIGFLIYVFVKLMIFFSKKYNIFIALGIIILIMGVSNFFVFNLLKISNFYFFGIERTYENLLKIFLSIDSGIINFPGTIGDRLVSFSRFLNELTLNPQYIIFGYGLFNSNQLNESFILESSLLYSLFFGGIFTFLVLHLFFLKIFFQNYYKKNNHYSKIIVSYFPSFYLINLIAFMAFYNISIFIYFLVLNYLSTMNEKDIV